MMELMYQFIRLLSEFEKKNIYSRKIVDIDINIGDLLHKHSLVSSAKIKRIAQIKVIIYLHLLQSVSEHRPVYVVK